MRIFLALALLAALPAWATDDYLCTITSTGTSVNSSAVAACNGNPADPKSPRITQGSLLSIQCDADAYYQRTTAAGTVTAGTGYVVTALSGFPLAFPQNTLSQYLAILSVTGTANCKIFVASAVSASGWFSGHGGSGGGFVTLGTTQTITGAKTFTKVITSTVASGANAVAFSTSGARLDLGAGTDDYAFSDGSAVATSGRFKPGLNLSSGSTAIELVDGTYQIFNAAGSAYIRAPNNQPNLQVSQISTDASPLVVNTLKVPVVHGTGTAEQAIESGTGSLTASALAVTFGTAFGATHPICLCSHIAAVPLPCGPTAAASTTAVTFAVPTGAGAIDWSCIGTR